MLASKATPNGSLKQPLWGIESKLFVGASTGGEIVGNVVSEKESTSTIANLLDFVVHEVVQLAATPSVVRMGVLAQVAQGLPISIGYN